MLLSMFCSNYPAAKVELQEAILTYSEEAELRGLEKGREEGIEKGREEGVERKAFEVARKMLARGMALSDIAEIVELPVDKIQILRQR